MPTIYRKTAKGVAEIETRAHRLPPRLRGVLIMVDGKRVDTELASMLPQAIEVLVQLSAQGFIEVLATLAEPAPAASAPSGTSGASGRPAAPASAPSFEARRGAIVRAFNELAGPEGEPMALRLEKAKSVGDLQALVPQATRIIDSLRGRAAAQQFVEKVDDL